MKNLLILLLVTLSTSLYSQHKVGIRAGLNFSSFSGELEENEDYGISSGFHFGINYTYLFNDNLSFRGEISYIQRGANQSLQDTSGSVYYIINPLEVGVDNILAFGEIDYQIEITNAYLSIPITTHYRVNKFEFFGGASVDFLIGPRARGLVDFRSDELIDEPFFFTQSLDYRYSSDVAGSFNDFVQDNIVININGENLLLPRFAGAYYNFTTAQLNGQQRFKRIDSHLIFGLNYFINPGFYIGARGEFGLFDITNDEIDISLRELDSNNEFILRTDTDRSISLSVSVGFRF